MMANNMKPFSTIVISLLAIIFILDSKLVPALTVNEQSDELGSIPVETAKPRNILVFGGNGMLGSSTVHKLIGRGYNVTIVNRGNWYWDSKQRIVPHVRSVSCDRKNNVTSCELLTSIIKLMNESNEKFHAVIDFSAYGPQDITDNLALLSGSVADLYVYISTDSVYDVSDPSGHKGHEGPGFGCKEEESVRPEDPYLKDLLARHHEYGNHKLEAEEELIKQRLNENGTQIPYVILRLPDVIGPRDTTYRFWIYQLWMKIAGVLTEQPVTIPQFLVDYNNSFVYVEDVASLIVDKILKSVEDENVKDQIYNVAWPQNITLEDLLKDISKQLNPDGDLNLKVEDGSESLYLYPSVRRGPINTSKISKLLDWIPTNWTDAIRETVSFYEAVMKNEEFETQRNEIIQILAARLYNENTIDFYSAVEKMYDINLNHFKPKDEL